MTDGPLVSIIIPAYRAEATLGAAISSALTQTYPHVEIVVCNDGSDDATSAIAHSYGERVVVVDQENRGLAEARNSAIRASSGDLLTLLDSDDILLPPHVEAAVARWRERDDARAFVSSNAYFLSRHGILPKRRIYTQHMAIPPADQRMRMIESNIASIFSTFPRAMWEELDGFSAQMRLMEDYDFWARGVFAGWTLLFENAPTALYRLTPGSLSSNAARMAEYDKLLHRRLDERYGDRLDSRERAQLDVSLSLDTAQEYRDRAAAALAVGDTEQAAEQCELAAQVAPSDRRIRLKARALRHAPLVGRLYAAREAKRLRETSR